MSECREFDGLPGITFNKTGQEGQLITDNEWRMKREMREGIEHREQKRLPWRCANQVHSELKGIPHSLRIVVHVSQDCNGFELDVNGSVHGLDEILDGWKNRPSKLWIGTAHSFDGIDGCLSFEEIAVRTDDSLLHPFGVVSIKKESLVVEERGREQ